jgi:hypothetical protein
VAWKITKDYLDPEPPNRVGYGEEHTRIPVYAVVLGYESQELPDAENKIDFRLYDDDGELYYEGILDDDEDCTNQLAALTWAEGDSGCTLIKVKRGDEWKIEIG